MEGQGGTDLRCGQIYFLQNNAKHFQREVGIFAHCFLCSTHVVSECLVTINRRNYILPLGLLYDYDARDNKYLCKWRSRQTQWTEHPNTTTAHGNKEAQKKVICGGIFLWKPSSLLLNKGHQIVAGARKKRCYPFPELIHFNKEHLNPCSDTDGRKEQPESWLQSPVLRWVISLQHPAKSMNAFFSFGRKPPGCRTPFPSSTMSLPSWRCAVTALELLAGSSSEHSGWQRQDPYPGGKALPTGCWPQALQTYSAVQQQMWALPQPK